MTVFATVKNTPQVRSYSSISTKEMSKYPKVLWRTRNGKKWRGCFPILWF